MLIKNVFRGVVIGIYKSAVMESCLVDSMGLMNIKALLSPCIILHI